MTKPAPTEAERSLIYAEAILLGTGRGTMRNEQVAMSPGHGCTVRGTVHLLMVEGGLRQALSPSAMCEPVPPEREEKLYQMANPLHRLSAGPPPHPGEDITPLHP